MVDQPDRFPTTERGVVRPLSSDVLDAIDRDTAAAGGPYEPSDERKGSVGTTMFDLPTSEDNTVTVLLPFEHLGSLPTQALVRIESLGDRRTYVGIVVSGPFAEPDGLRGDAAVIVTTTVNGQTFVPNYHGRVHVELLGEEATAADGTTVLTPARFRPLPNSPVFALTGEDTVSLLHCSGDVRLGLAVGHDSLPVGFPSDSKDVLPRHTGILGTTGGGKSTTVAGLVARLQAAGTAVVLLDTEGEYTHLNEPTDSASMLAALQRAGLTPSGIPNTAIYHLVGRECANPRHPKVQEYCLWFYNLAPFMVAELLEMTDAQQDRFIIAYELTRQLLRDCEIFPRRGHPGDEDRAQNWDDQETGYPMLKLEHLLDVVAGCIHKLKNKDGPPYQPTSAAFRSAENARKLWSRIEASAHQFTTPVSWLAVNGKLHRLRRLRLFDQENVSHLPYANMLRPGQVSIIDLHDTDSTQVNNLAIAELLRGVQEQQERNYEAAQKEGRRPTPTAVIIEEAHEFLSAQRLAKSPTLFQQVARIARRGRKRWLGLVFVTQLPQHLPDDLLGLINNLILHKLNDTQVIARLKQRNVGGIDDSLWRRLPELAPGQAVVSLTSMRRPLLVAIDPAAAKLRMVE